MLFSGVNFESARSTFVVLILKKKFSMINLVPTVFFPGKRAGQPPHPPPPPTPDWQADCRIRFFEVVL